MQLVQTKDNSYTFFNEEYQEYYHSLSGAIEEAREKYVKPLEVKDGQTILDICFGLGYNTYAALITAKNLKVIGLEKDKEILEKIQTLEGFEIIKKLAKNLEYKDENYNLKLIIGDAKETIKQLDQEFDIVFLDPFSPKKLPELWTEEFFKEIYRVMKPGAKLATYSCAGQVRRNFIAAGFEVKDGPCVRRRGPSTIAIKK